MANTFNEKIMEPMRYKILLLALTNDRKTKNTLLYVLNKTAPMKHVNIIIDTVYSFFLILQKDIFLPKISRDITTKGIFLVGLIMCLVFKVN